VSAPAQPTETDPGRLSRIEQHFSARLFEESALLRTAGITAVYLPPGTPHGRAIPVAVDGVNGGAIEVEGGAGEFAVALLERLVHAWSVELAAAFREEALLEELSSSWESLEALYEVSSSLRLSNSPDVLLQGLLDRATTIGPDLAAALWLLQPDGTLHAAAVQNCPPLPDCRPSGPVGRCIATRHSLLVKSRTALAAMQDLPEHLRVACQAAVAPIITSEGLKGVLELWRTVPGGEFTTHLRRLIEALAHQAGLVMDNDRLNRAFVESTRIRRDIEIGSSIQQTLLFGRPPADLPGISVAAVSKPSQTVDGDFYDFTRWRDACLDVLVGDVMGKGIPAALLGAAVKSAFLRAMARVSADREGGGLGEILRSVHQDMVPDLLRLESFVSLCYARFDLNRRTVEFVDCGHPRTLHYRRAAADCAFLEGGSLPLGFSQAVDYEPVRVPFAPGDLFLFYSDGLAEAQDAEGSMFGTERLAQVVAEEAEHPAARILAAVEDAVTQFAGSQHLRDDFTCVIVEIGRDLPVEIVRGEWTSSLANGAVVREWAGGHLRRLFPKVEDELVYWAVELAATETFTNIVEHSYHGDESRLVRVELFFYPDRVALRFVHWGDGFDPEQVAPPSFDGTRDRGFGLFLVANTMDSTVYDGDGELGHRITMEKRFPAVTE
jgi:sigma-B regulation protein RsbU (phosphoserine phosphatase)